VEPRRILASHRQQLPDPVVGRAGTACRGSGTTAVVLGRDLLAVPAQDRLGRRQRCHLRQPLSAQRSALFGEETTLRVREAQSLWAEAAAKHEVLRTQVLDRFALLASQPARDQVNQELKRSQGPQARPTLALRSPTRTPHLSAQFSPIEFRDHTSASSMAPSRI
jgi:hypothetical protein